MAFVGEVPLLDPMLVDAPVAWRMNPASAEAESRNTSAHAEPAQIASFIRLTPHRVKGIPNGDSRGQSYQVGIRVGKLMWSLNRDFLAIYVEPPIPALP